MQLQYQSLILQNRTVLCTIFDKLIIPFSQCHYKKNQPAGSTSACPYARRNTVQKKQAAPVGLPVQPLVKVNQFILRLPNGFQMGRIQNRSFSFISFTVLIFYDCRHFQPLSLFQAADILRLAHIADKPDIGNFFGIITFAVNLTVFPL